MSIFYAIIITVFGLMFGSFMGLVTYRLPRGLLLGSSRTVCTRCESKVKWYDMIPVLSYLLLKGRCRVCKEKIPLKNPIIELMNALLWLVAYFMYGVSFELLFICIFISILIITSFIDLDIKEVPTSLVVSILSLGAIMFILSFFDSARIGNVLWWHRLIGMVCVSAPLLLMAILTQGGIGGGDIKLSFAVGLFLGYRLVLIGTLFGIIIAAVAGTALLIIGGKNKKFQLPLIPFLSAGYVLSLFIGDAFTSWLF